MKYLLLSFSVLLVLASTAAAIAPGVSYQYDNKFRWDRKQLDSPPLPVGGEPALAKGLDYPIDLRRRHIEGATTVSVTVDAHGRIQSLRFAPHVAPELEKLITTAVYQCPWKPGQRHGRAVIGTVSFPARFVIAMP